MNILSDLGGTITFFLFFYSIVLSQLVFNFSEKILTLLSKSE